MNTIINYSAFGILTLLWLGFGAALLFNQTILDTVWQSFRGMPMLLQIILIFGLGFATIYTFFPKQA